MLNLGDRGEEVSRLQKMLSLLGYDLVIDGHYGDLTKTAVKKFQKQKKLINDGIVGDKTMKLIEAEYKKLAIKEELEDERDEFIDEFIDGNYSLQFIRDYQLDDSQYIKQKFAKKQIFIHFTAGGPSAKNVINFWDDTAERVATAFVVDRDTGEVYECFNPDYWSYHLGIKGTNGSLDKTSIGIELCAYGGLKNKNDKFYAWPKDFSERIIPHSEVYSLTEPFRGYNHFESFTEGQLLALEYLLSFLIEKYNIEIQYEFDDSWFEYNRDVISKNLPGIWTHTTVRKDKSDIYPDHRVIEILNRLANKYN